MQFVEYTCNLPWGRKTIGQWVQFIMTDPLMANVTKSNIYLQDLKPT